MTALLESLIRAFPEADRIVTGRFSSDSIGWGKSQGFIWVSELELWSKEIKR